jgi:hypothetical protein
VCPKASSVGSQSGHIGARGVFGRRLRLDKVTGWSPHDRILVALEDGERPEETGMCIHPATCHVLAPPQDCQQEGHHCGGTSTSHLQNYKLNKPLLLIVTEPQVSHYSSEK